MYAQTVGRGGNLAHPGNNEDDDAGDGDYVDHLQQPNNTKKRKVPTAPHQTQLSGGLNDGSGIGDDDGSKMDGSELDAAAGLTAAGHLRGRPRISAITIAGLQHKELLKRRRVQLSTVLGAVTASDELALDQALGARYNVVGVAITAPRPSDYTEVRELKRKRRKVLATIDPSPNQPDLELSSDAFSFDCHSAGEWFPTCIFLSLSPYTLASLPSVL